jgi:hypothetical protein
MSAMQRVLATSEPVHSEMPLHGDDRPLDRLQETEAQDDRQWEPEGGVDPERRRVMNLGPQHQSDDDVPYNGHDDVGRHVIGAMVKELFTAHIANIDDFEEFAEKTPLAAPWALAQCAAGQRYTGRGLYIVHRDTSGIFHWRNV